MLPPDLPHPPDLFGRQYRRRQQGQENQYGHRGAVYYYENTGHRLAVENQYGHIGAIENQYGHRGAMENQFDHRGSVDCFYNDDR